MTKTRLYQGLSGPCFEMEVLLTGGPWNFMVDCAGKHSHVQISLSSPQGRSPNASGWGGCFVTKP